MKLSDAEREILIYLASETRLSLAGIAAATGRPLDATASAMGRLLDLSIVELHENDYLVSSPIQGTVRRTERGLGRQWYQRAFHPLEEEYWSDDRSLPSISVVDATLRAGLRVGVHTSQGYSALVRPSLLINAAQEMYHRQKYDVALEYLDRAAVMGRRTAQLDELRIKSLAQIGRFGEARRRLREFREHNDRRQWYLEGFVDRKAGAHDQACSDFQRGYAAGERSTSLLRDYADSLLRTDAFDDAARIAQEALARAPGNTHVLDLVARIELTAGTTDAAVSALHAVDVDQQYAIQRRAEFLIYRRGNAESVRRAVAICEERLKEPGAPLQVLVTLAHALVRVRGWERLSQVKDELRKRRDIDNKSVLGKIDFETAIAQGDWRAAERFLPEATFSTEDLNDAATVYELKGADRSVLLSERNDAQFQAAELRKRAGSKELPIPSPTAQYE